MISPSGEQITIAAGDQQAVVVEVGGGLRSYSAGGRELVDGYRADEMSSSGRGQVLIPWPNRLQDGSYEFDGRRHQLPLNEPQHRNAIHGLVRWAAWTVAEREPHRAVMEHVLYPQPGYPFSLRISIEYALSDSGLRVRTTATNLGTDPCPYGSGAHPYLTLGTETIDDLMLRVLGEPSCGPTSAGFRSAWKPWRTRSTIFESRGGLARQGLTMRSPTLSGIRMASHGWSSEIRSAESSLALGRPELSVLDDLHWRLSSRRLPSQSCRRTHDLSAERISNRGGSDPAGARLLVHKHMGHRTRKRG